MLLSAEDTAAAAAGMITEAADTDSTGDQKDLLSTKSSATEEYAMIRISHPAAVIKRFRNSSGNYTETVIFST